jgi:A/G-specific adenine glycosylase
MPERETKFLRRLLRWASVNKRDFPWRKNRTSYRVLIAEQLLRKTTAKQVQAVYDQFMKRFPTPEHLARARPREIERIIRSLGMEKKRSLTLKLFGKAIQTRFDGKVPQSRDLLLTLPGVGEYAADAVLSLTIRKSAPMVDRNAVRVLSRVFGLDLSKNYRKAVSETRSFVLPIMSEHSSAKVNFGLLDFAALVCAARSPKCHVCPMQGICDYEIRLKKD